MHKVEIYNYKRKSALFAIDVKTGNCTLQETNNILIIDTLNTNKYVLKIIRFLLKISYKRSKRK